MVPIRPASVAGMFYPLDPVQLRDQVDVFLRSADPVVAGAHPPKILIAPHAGYVYSGAVAAQAHALLAPWREQVRRVVVIGPAHRVAARGVVAASAPAFQTPLGRVEVDRDAVAQVAGLPDCGIDDLPHAREHAIEVQLPFLQVVLGDFALVPLLVGLASADSVGAVLRRLQGGAETVFIVSSDLSHYLPYDTARRIDRATVGRVLALEADIDHEEACGATAINAAIAIARQQELQPRLLALCNSGDTAGERARVVGYCALAFEGR